MHPRLSVLQATLPSRGEFKTLYDSLRKNTESLQTLNAFFLLRRYGKWVYHVRPDNRCTVYLLRVHYLLTHIPLQSCSIAGYPSRTAPTAGRRHHTRPRPRVRSTLPLTDRRLAMVPLQTRLQRLQPQVRIRMRCHFCGIAE